MLPQLDLRVLTTFVQAANLGSLSAAAVRVGRTQSAVTTQIKQLEGALGHKLFHRSGNGVRLTANGERLLIHAERLLKLHDEAVMSFTGQGLRGSVIFGSPEDYLIAFFPTLLKSFGNRFPDVEIKVVSAPTNELQTLLLSRKVDLALISTPDLNDALNIVRTEHLVWVGSKPTLELHNFHGRLPLALPALNAMDHRMACDALASAGMDFRIYHASNSLTGLIAVTRSGLAISVMTQKAVPPDLFVLGDPLPKLPSLGVIIAMTNAEKMPATEAFAQHIREILPLL